jgi:hypothetical protein
MLREKIGGTHAQVLLFVFTTFLFFPLYDQLSNDPPDGFFLHFEALWSRSREDGERKMTDGPLALVTIICFCYKEITPTDSINLDVFAVKRTFETQLQFNSTQLQPHLLRD